MQSSRPSLILEVPVETARRLLGDCLGRLQDVQYPGLDVQTLIEHIAKTIKTLFDIGKYDPMEEPHKAGVRSAMDMVGRSLEMLQNVDSNDTAVFESSKSMAKVLSILYPISKAQEVPPLERASQVPPKEIAPHPRRTMTRIALTADIGFQSENNFYTGFSEDISEGGIFIATYDSKPIGTKMSVTFSLPNGYVVMAEGTVRWLREFNPLTPEMEPGMGIQFDELAPQDKAQIEAFMQSQGAMFYDD